MLKSSIPYDNNQNPSWKKKKKNINVCYNKLQKIKHGPMTIVDIVTKPTKIEIVCSFLRTVISSFEIHTYVDIRYESYLNKRKHYE